MKRQEFEFKSAQVRKDMLDALMTAMSDQIVKTVSKKTSKDPWKGLEIIAKFASDKRNVNLLNQLPINMVKDTDEMMYRLVVLIEKELKIDWTD